MNTATENKFEHGLSTATVILIALAFFLIPFSNASQVPCSLLAFCGIAVLIITRGSILKDKSMHRFITLILCYIIPVAISIVGSATTKAPVKVLTMSLFSLFGGIAVLHGCQAEKKRRLLLSIFTAAVGFWVVDTVFQMIVGRDVFGFVPLGIRYGGPFTDQYMLGAYLGIFSPLLLFYGIQKKWPKVVVLIIFILTSLAELISNTRTGWVMYAVVSMVFFYHMVFKAIKHRIIVLTCCLLVGLATIFGLYKTNPAFVQRLEESKSVFNGDVDSIENALSGRLIIWHTSVNAIKDNPINGVGARNLRKVYSQYKPDREYGRYTGEEAIDWAAHPHQLILEVGVGTGLIGLIGLLLMYLSLWKTWREGTPIQKFYGLPLGTALLAAYFPINSHSAHYSSKYALLLWMLIALFIAFLKNEWSEINEKEKPTQS